MNNPEDVDEINEYLQARRKKQELGELPKPDATPGFVKKLSSAIFGAPKINKVPLNSTQITNASPQAQDAVRKQLAEIMKEKGRANAAPKPMQGNPISVSVPTPRPSLSTVPSSTPRFPQAEMWKTTATKPTLPPAQSSLAKPNPMQSTTPIKVSAYIPARPVASPSTTPPKSDFMIRSTVSGPSSSTPSSRETARYMPPWVARDQKTNPLAPRVTPPASLREKENINETKSVPLSSARMPFTVSQSSSTSIVRQESTLPSISRDDAPIPSPKNDSSRRDSFQSGEVKIDDVSTTLRPAKPVEPAAPVHSAHDMDREMTEEEALEKLPFEDVEGLSAEDLEYLERKEKEHRAAQEAQESDHVSPDALHAQLDRQSQQVEATATPLQNNDNAASDEKKKILERLRHMMSTEIPPTP